MTANIKELVAEGLLDRAISLFREQWRIEGNVLRARLTLIERELASGRITQPESMVMRERLARDVLAELDDLEKRAR